MFQLFLYQIFRDRFNFKLRVIFFFARMVFYFQDQQTFLCSLGDEFEDLKDHKIFHRYGILKFLELIFPLWRSINFLFLIFIVVFLCVWQESLIIFHSMMGIFWFFKECNFHNVWYVFAMILQWTSSRNKDTFIKFFYCKFLILFCYKTKFYHLTIMTR